MASVLLCQDERLDRRVAVKRLHADSPAEVERRFVREAKLGASLNHPNLVSVFDTAADDEGVLIVMEYVEGEPLSRVLRRGPLPPTDVARMARDLGDALDHAHRQGVVHRDVKPANVLLRGDGVTKLADLGIATASDQTRITRSGTVLGTAAYMAPEQLEGGPTGPAADVYALAAVCFEALAGQRPRRARSPVEIARQVATEPPPDLRERAPGLPDAAAEWLMRGMARDANERPGSAGVLADGLARALEGEPRTAPTRPIAPPRTRRGGRARDRHERPVAAIAIALAVLALAGAGVLAAVLAGDGGEQPGAVAPDQPSRDQSGREQSAQDQPADTRSSQDEPPSDEPAGDEPAPDQSAPDRPAGEQPATSDAASGAELNEQGFALMQQGDYAGAIPVLQNAVEAFPAGTDDLNYAYALFNLGKSLRLAGRPEEAIPILEQRLQIPNQTETVRAELDAARRDAGRR
jgi:serine/threonine-protein kinase